MTGRFIEPEKPVTTDPEGEPTLEPQPKVLAAGVAGAVTVLVVFIVHVIWPDFDIPAEAVAAFTTLVSFAAAYFKRPSKTN